jgi:ATP-dependent Clp protease, protease subunit
MKALINFYAEVSEQNVNNLINFITQQQMAAQQQGTPLEEIIIQISSNGGSSDHGLLAYNYLNQLNIPKTTIGMGNVDSAAVMIFCAGAKRLAMPSCRFTLHEAQTTIIQGTFNGTKLHEIADLNQRITNDYCRVIANNTGRDLVSVEKEVAKGSVMSTDEAITYKLITGIQNTPYLSDMNNLNIMTINNPVMQLQRPPGQSDQVRN